MTQKITTQLEVKVAHRKLWEALNDPNLLAKALPGFVTKVEVVEGDGFSEGSVRKIHFGPAVKHATYLNEKIESVDEDLHIICANVFEGGSIGKDFSYARTTIKCTPTPHGTTLVDWAFEYDAIVEEPPLQKAREAANRTFRAIEAYLLSTPP